MVMKVIAIACAIILALLAVIGMAACVFVALCLYDDQVRQNNRINNKTRK